MFNKKFVGSCFLFIISLIFVMSSFIFLNRENSKQITKRKENFSKIIKAKKEIKEEVQTIKESKAPAIHLQYQSQVEVDQQQLPTHEEFKNEFERFDDKKIDSIIERITQQIETNKYLFKANSGHLSNTEYREFETLMRKKESLYLIKADRLVAEMDREEGKVK